MTVTTARAFPLIVAIGPRTGPPEWRPCRCGREGCARQVPVMTITPARFWSSPAA